MSKDIKVPEVGESITEGMLTAWLKEEGELVEQEDPLFELETDKITMEVPSPYSGRLHIEVPAGETVRVGQVVGQVDTSAKAKASPETAEAQATNRTAEAQATSASASSDTAASASASSDTALSESAASESAASESAASESADSPRGSSKEARAKAGPDGSRSQAPSRLGVPGFGPSAPAATARIPAQGPRPASDEAFSQRPGRNDPDPRERLRSQARDTADLSPAVRRLVVEHQLTPEEISATGPGGRLTKADVLDYLESSRQLPEAAMPAAGVPLVSDEDLPAGSAHASGSTRHDHGKSEGAEAPRLAARPLSTASLASQSPGDPRQTRAKMSPLRSRIAERLVQAQQTAAMLTTFNEVDMSAVLGLRERFKAPFEKKHGIRLGFMSFFVKAAVDALKAVPQVNAFIEGDEIVTNHFYDIGVAVGTDRGLVVPVIRECDHLDFAGIERAIGEYARRVKEKKIGLEDLQGGCFTLSNGGVYGSLLSTPILNPPQSGILGMHAIKKRPVVIDDQIVIRPMMYLALSYDHRLVDGKNAVTFLRRIVECLEAPERMLMDV